MDEAAERIPIAGDRAERWRAFAAACALALGINVWLTIAVVPGIVLGAIGTIGASGAVLALAVLVIGMAKKSDALLLFGFPAAVLIPVVAAPAIARGAVYGPLRLILVATGLCAYLFGASFLTSFREPAPADKKRLLSSAQSGVPARWRRRLRLYRALAALSVVYPLVLLWAVNFNDDNQAFLRQMYPGKNERMTALLSIAVTCGWVALYARFFLGTLKPHRTGDRQLLRGLKRLRKDAQTGHLRLSFYLGTAIALALMAAVLFSRT